MSSAPRRLTFAVSTSLLTASLSLGAAGCTPKNETKADGKTNDDGKGANDKGNDTNDDDREIVNIAPRPEGDGEGTGETGAAGAGETGAAVDPDAEPPHVNVAPTLDEEVEQPTTNPKPAPE